MLRLNYLWSRWELVINLEYKYKVLIHIEEKEECVLVLPYNVQYYLNPKTKSTIQDGNETSMHP